MRVLAIGDIHGCSVAFDTLLAHVALRPDDLIITLGDHVDRGPDSCGVIERLLALQRRYRLVPLRGNHEQMMAAYRTHLDPTWLLCGGRETLASYAATGGKGTITDVPDHHWDFLEKGCRSWFETDSHFFVHANADANLPLVQQPGFLLYWEEFKDPPPHMSGKVMVCGHTEQRTGHPRSIGHAICIDTWAYGRGWLTCLDVITGAYWQANQLGGRRSGWLDGHA
jgi:serine/threonine protein phosphatase 1